jgi:hypothetical protein
MFLTSCSPQILKDHAAAMTQVIAYSPRNADLAAFDQTLEPSGDVHAVAKNIVVLDHNIADIDADPEAPPAPFRLAFIRLLERRLDLDRAANRVEHAAEFGEHAIPAVFAIRPRCRAMSSSTRARRADNVAIVVCSSRCIKRL